MANKHALVIGINEYTYMEDEYQLTGCVNDAKLVRLVLIQKFGFPKDNIVTLFNQQATRQGMRDAMQHMVSTLAKDDIFVFHYSGHGHQCRVKTEFTDEGSGKLNCILPSDDSEPKPDSDDVYFREIREHEINEWLQKIAQKTRYTTLIFDACHSGTITRGADEDELAVDGGRQFTARFVPESARQQIVTLDSASPEMATRAGEGPKTSMNWLTLSENYVVISGCRDTQKSKETYFYEGDKPFKHGVLTYSLCQALKDAKPRSTYRDIFEQVSAKVVTLTAQQNPQIEGAIDREVLGVNDIEPLNFILLEEVNEEYVSLAGGLAHGVSKGSLWDVYLPHTKQKDPQALVATVEIEKVEGLSATGRVIKRLQSIDVGARAVLQAHSQLAENAATPLLVHVQNLPPSLGEPLARDIVNSPLLRLASSTAQADLIGFTAASLRSLPIQFHRGLSANAVFPVAGFLTPERELSMPIHAVDASGIEQLFIENLEKIAKYRNIVGLQNEDSQLDAEFNIYRRLLNDSVELANGGSCAFSSGERMVLEFKNNMPDTTVFFNVIWLTANCEVMHFYPPRTSSEELSPGNTVRIGDNQNTLGVSLSDSYFADIGVEFIKVFYSTAETDFRFLNQQGVRSGSIEQTATSVIPSFQLAATGEPVTSEVTEVDDWQAITRSFVLKR